MQIQLNLEDPTSKREVPLLRDHTFIPLNIECEGRVMKVEDDHLRVIPAPVIFVAFITLGLGLNWMLPLLFLANVLVARVAGFFVVGVSFLVGGSAVVEMRRHHTSPNPHKPVTALVEDGVFRYSRNPVYLSLLVLYVGIAICVNVLWLILLCPALYWSVEKLMVKPEEDYLERRFSIDYVQYKKRVRRWI